MCALFVIYYFYSEKSERKLLTKRRKCQKLWALDISKRQPFMRKELHLAIQGLPVGKGACKNTFVLYTYKRVKTFDVRKRLRQ